jgi:hypothetical protein
MTSDLKGDDKMFESYEKFQDSLSKLTFASSFLSFLFGGFCSILSISFFIDINKEQEAGSIFKVIQIVFEPSTSNIVNGIISMLLAIFLIRNGINKKWPKVN